MSFETAEYTANSDAIGALRLLEAIRILGLAKKTRSFRPHAREYVRGMWLMLQQDAPDDYVLATGTTTVVRDFVAKAFSEAGTAIRWDGEGIAEKGFDADSGRLLIEVDPR